MLSHSSLWCISVAVVFFVCNALQQREVLAETIGTLKLVDKVIAEKHNAKCLDGSLPGYYIAKGSSTQFVLFFLGGGWCRTEENCVERSNTTLGSTKTLGQRFGMFSGGYITPNATVNPVFSNFTRVLLWYCDGASFAGNRETPLNVSGTTIHFRGLANLNAMLDDLKVNYGLDHADEVLVSGGSAGGLAVFIHSEAVKQQLPSVSKYKVSPGSGFFINHTSVSNVPVYGNMIKYVFNMQNASAGVNQKCIQDKSFGERHACMLPQIAYQYVESPIFLLQSQLDSWQMKGIYPNSQNPHWNNCTQLGYKNCNASQIDDLNAYGQSMLINLKQASTFTKPGNGGFFVSCFEHVAEQSNGWWQYEVHGTKMREAAEAWWFAPTTEAYTRNTYIQPALLQHSVPHQTNPTCY
eukprot:m.41397 g.41397  ORF g.41397 m.41397 type:complete len:409 (+) comp10421_c0_seq1:62-1288(+)